jgi:hypothetical protein
MRMGDKNIIDIFRFKTKGCPVYLIRAFTLIETALNKNLQSVAFDIETGAGDCACSSEKFE